MSLDSNEMSSRGNVKVIPLRRDESDCYRADKDKECLDFF